jgi:hypothetical protein
MKVKDFYFLKILENNTASDVNLDNKQPCITKFTSHEAIKKRHRRHRLGGWSGHYYLSVCHRARSAVSGRMMVPASIKEHQNESKQRN